MSTDITKQMQKDIEAISKTHWQNEQDHAENAAALLDLINVHTHILFVRTTDGTWYRVYPTNSTGGVCHHPVKFLIGYAPQEDPSKMRTFLPPHITDVLLCSIEEYSSLEADEVAL